MPAGTRRPPPAGAFPPLSRPRPPERASITPHPLRVPRTFLPGQRGGRARMIDGDQPRDPPWAALPGPPGLLTSPVERCRGRPPAHAAGTGRARLSYVGREDPGDQHPPPAAQHSPSAAGRQHARSRPRPANPPGTTTPAVAKTPDQDQIPGNPPEPLDKHLLRWWISTSLIRGF